MIRQVKAGNQRSKRFLDDRSAKVVENVKTCLLLKGSHTSELGSSCLKDFHLMKKPNSVVFNKKNQIRPFDDHSSLEYFSQQNDTSLFVFSSHTKKRPNNLIMGRMFDHQLLDMFEFGFDADTYISISEHEEFRKTMLHYGSKPCFVFQGEFDSNPDLALFKNFVIDCFRGEVLDKINLASLDRVIYCSAIGNKIYFRQYAIALKKSGSRIPRVELEEVGPNLDLTFRRRKSASEELRRESMKLPKETAMKKRKNIEYGQLGETFGRVHMQRQDLDQMALRKMKGLKKRKAAQQNVDGAAQEQSADDNEDDVEDAGEEVEHGEDDE